MGTEADLVIRGGTVVDGTGREPFEADVAVKDGRIAAVGDVPGRGREEIDARGLLVTPGFVDVHTHYDGQAVWDSHLAPSAQHGVTTAVMGTCWPVLDGTYRLSINAGSVCSQGSVSSTTRYWLRWV